MAHTAAPWYVSGPTDPDGTPCETASADGHVYDISDSPPDANGECEHVIATVWANRPSLQATAAGDAALIAAAPELLAACKLMLEFNRHGEYACWCDELGSKCDNCIVADAIRKAEGRIA